MCWPASHLGIMGILHMIGIKDEIFCHPEEQFLWKALFLKLQAEFGNCRNFEELGDSHFFSRHFCFIFLLSCFNSFCFLKNVSLSCLGSIVPKLASICSYSHALLQCLICRGKAVTVVLFIYFLKASNFRTLTDSVWEYVNMRLISLMNLWDICMRRNWSSRELWKCMLSHAGPQQFFKEKWKNFISEVCCRTLLRRQPWAAAPSLPQ